MSFRGFLTVLFFVLAFLVSFSLWLENDSNEKQTVQANDQEQIVVSIPRSYRRIVPPSPKSPTVVTGPFNVPTVIAQATPTRQNETQIKSGEKIGNPEPAPAATASRVEQSQNLSVEVKTVKIACGTLCKLAPQGFTADIYYPVASSGGYSLGPNQANQASYLAVAFSGAMMTSAQDFKPLLTKLASLGYVVIAPNRSERKSCDFEEGIYLLTVGLDYLNKLNTDPTHPLFDQINFDQGAALVGFSLGGEVVLYTPEETPSGVMIGAKVAIAPNYLTPDNKDYLMSTMLPKILPGGLVSLFNPLDDSARARVGRLMELASRIGINNLMDPGVDFDSFLEKSKALPEALSQFRVPTAYIVGNKDGIATVSGKEKVLYQAANPNKAFIEILGANHLNGISFADPELAASLQEFGIDHTPTLTADEQLTITTKYIDAWLRTYLQNDPNAKKILEDCKSDPDLAECIYEQK